MHDTSRAPGPSPVATPAPVYESLESLLLAKGKSLGKRPRVSGLASPADGSHEVVAAAKVRQGHAYRWLRTQQKVIALDHSEYPRVVALTTTPDGQIYVSPPFNVEAKDLEPLPMAYFHGQVPK